MTDSLRVESYDARLKGAWDAFVRSSKNGTFLFERDYMDYHADRFSDSSLLVYDADALVAVLPANRRGRTLESHGGLTYGGFVTSESMGAASMLALFDAALRWCASHDIDQLIYKAIPHIYHTIPAEEDRYALFLAGATSLRTSLLAVVDARKQLPFQERRRRQARKAGNAGLVVRETDDLQGYWTVLADRLRSRYNSSPVHTADEIVRLRLRFPENIRLFAAFGGTAMHAGVLVFESANVARAQYIVASEAGLESGALDLIFDTLLRHTFSHKRYFDLGTSDESGGMFLNRNLIAQKEGFGARGVSLDIYVIDVRSAPLDRLRAEGQ